LIWKFSLVETALAPAELWLSLTATGTFAENPEKTYFLTLSGYFN
jgi:hypothetical protein